ncbi:MAG: Uncharacterised protein [Prochlorococcus marinus str. MIT 9215]|nr:MAG: Uncharacterised protein [Prochlorococcus marinus str. MIT 9215]
MIANSRDPNSLFNPCGSIPAPLLAQHWQGISTSTNRRQHQRQHLCLPASTPTKQSVGEWITGIPGQFMGAKPANPRMRSHCGQTRREAKAVWQPSQLMRPIRESIAAVVLTKRELTPKRRCAHEYTIRFNPRPINRLPATSSTCRLNLSKETGSVMLDPLIESWRRMAKAKLREAFH